MFAFFQLVIYVLDKFVWMLLITIITTQALQMAGVVEAPKGLGEITYSEVGMHFFDDGFSLYLLFCLRIFNIFFSKSTRFRRYILNDIYLDIYHDINDLIFILISIILKNKKLQIK